MTRYILLSFLFLCGCGIPTVPLQAQNIDPSLQSYVDSFITEGAARGVKTDDSHLAVVYGDNMPPAPANEKAIGYCQWEKKGNTVVIDRDNWNSFNATDKEELIFHELGHCLLMLQHINNVENSYVPEYNETYPNAPSSVMNALHFSGSYYSQNRNEYLDRLFNIPGGKLYGAY